MSELIYLHDVPFSEAWSLFVDELKMAGLWHALEGEEIPLEHANGRITAKAIWAKISSPHYHSAAMDGFALPSSTTAGASENSPQMIAIGAQCVYVDTGDPIPDWADAVIPIEHVEPLEPEEKRSEWKAFQLRSAVAPWSHVRPLGEDIVATELLLPAGHRIRPVDLGALAGSGHATVNVCRQPRVAILPTGSELVPPGSDPNPGDIIEYNSLVLSAQIEEWGGRSTRLPIVPDNFNQISSVIEENLQNFDLLLINAGSSAGSEDFTSQVVASLGKLLVHGVAIRPGHPVILGMLRVNFQSASEESGRGSIPVIGVPGYPVSAALTGEIFVEPLLAKWLGRPAHQKQTLKANLTRKVHSKMGDDEYLRVTVGKVGGRTVVSPLSRGAGTITSLVRADGIVRIPSGVQGMQAGELVTVYLYRTPEEIDRTIVFLGSHDLTIDLIAQHLARRNVRVSSANIGSMGGLIALQRKEAHAAGSHLLDPETGEYNLSYVKKYLPGTALDVITLVYRQQGLIIPQGNPRKIKSLDDLRDPEIHIVNRQRGSGTRLLLDFHLAELGINGEEINGYAWEEYTHMTLAAAVASGRADCGLGILAAANALALDFIPLFEERYDLIIPNEFSDSTLLTPLFDLLASLQFREEVHAIPGYDTREMGKLVASFS